MDAVGRRQSSNPRGQILLPVGNGFHVLGSLQTTVEHGSGAFLG
jgi:hypothetical protein